jgi:hypothetical protein
MKRKKLFLGSVLAGVLVSSGVVLAEFPGVFIDGGRHPNLADAQKHIQQTYQKIDEAEQTNEDNLGGHGQKAKDLLLEANRELTAGAEFADHPR